MIGKPEIIINPPGYYKKLGLVKFGMIGAVLFFALFLFSIFFHGGFAILGVQDDRLQMVIDILTSTFPLQITLYILWLALLHIIYGFIVGLWSSLLATGTAIRLGFMVTIHLLFYLRQVVITPQLYAEFWLMHGGWRQALQEAATDYLPPIVFSVLLIALAVVAVMKFNATLERKTRHLIAAGLAMAFLLYTIASTPLTSSRARADKEHPNIILIGLDSLRPDKLSFSGYERDTSPSIDNLARKGIFFSQVYTPIPRTFPAWVSLLTGVSPPVHGVRNMFPTFSSRASIPKTITDALRDKGYKTAIISDFAGDIFPRIDLGFDDVDAPTLTMLTLAQVRLTELMTHLFPYVNNSFGRRLLPVLDEFAQNADPEILTDKAIEKLKRMAPQQPYLFSLFYSTTHFPFSAPYPYYKEYTDANYSGPYRYHKYTVIGREEILTEDDKKHIGALYDGSLKAVDDQLQRLFKFLDKEGIAENSYIFIFGDHGEDLLEIPDTPIAHGDQLRSEFALKTTIILAGPGLPQNTVIDSRVNLYDISATIAELTGIEWNTSEAQSLIPLARGQEQGDRRIYSETGLWYSNEGSAFYQTLRLPYPDVTHILNVDPLVNHEMVVQKQWEQLTNIAKHRAWIENGYKLIRMPTIEGNLYELYDLEHDPLCLNNIAHEQPELLEQMKIALHQYLSEIAPDELIADREAEESDER
jgi:arylsulfatase A-like enzyme